MKGIGFAPLIGWLGTILLSASSTTMPWGGGVVGLVLLTTYGALVM